MNDKPLTPKDRWMLSYIEARVNSWHDIKDEAARSIHKVKTHADFVDWGRYFLTELRKEELTLAWQQMAAKQLQLQKPKQDKKIRLELDEKTAKLLLIKAKQARCSVSDYIQQRLAS